MWRQHQLVFPLKSPNRSENKISIQFRRVVSGDVTPPRFHNDLMKVEESNLGGGETQFSSSASRTSVSLSASLSLSAPYTGGFSR